ncbi:hypothetical protein K439DRAFT_1070443 [Ramaria rubella]|nr:hypothetical protein K439DRAFT_1070443 [Ramaria rubella]
MVLVLINLCYTRCNSYHLVTTVLMICSQHHLPLSPIPTTPTTLPSDVFTNPHLTGSNGSSSTITTGSEVAPNIDKQNPSDAMDATVTMNSHMSTSKDAATSVPTYSKVAATTLARKKRAANTAERTGGVQKTARINKEKEPS